MLDEAPAAALILEKAISVRHTPTLEKFQTSSAIPKALSTSGTTLDIYQQGVMELMQLPLEVISSLVDHMIVVSTDMSLFDGLQLRLINR